MGNNAAGSAKGHIVVGGGEAAAGGAGVAHPASEQVVAPLAEELLLAVGGDGPGGMVGSNAGGEALGAGSHRGFAAVMQQLQLTVT